MSVESLSVVILSTPRPCVGALICNLKGQAYDDLILEIGHDSPSAGRNAGLKKVKTSHVLFLDDDVLLAPDAIAKGRKQMEEQGAHYGQSKIVGGVENAMDRFVGGAQWWSVDVLNMLGGFDEDFPFFNEDLVMGYVAEKAKMTRGFFDESLVFHYNIGSFERLVRGNETLKKKYPDLYKKVKAEIR